MGIYVKEENQPWNHKQIAGNATGDDALDATSDNNIKNKVATAKFNEIESDLTVKTGFLDVDNVTSLASGTTSYTALENCYVRYYLASSGLGECFVKINGHNIASFRSSAANQGFRNIIPVKAGQTISVTGGESALQEVIPFN